MRFKILLTLFVLCVYMGIAKEMPGANIPWTTYEAERMHTNGIIIGPEYSPYKVATESSGQRCVKLTAKNQYAEFTATAIANTMVIRFSLPDSKDGNGQTSTLGIYTNGILNQQKKVNSGCSWLYGKYPFSNNTGAGSPRHFYDEIRLTGLTVKKGDVIRIQREDHANDDAAYCIIDLVDLENVTPPLQAPANYISITDKSIGGHTNGDYTQAFKNCIDEAIKTGKTVWIPVGVFKITGDIPLPANLKIIGAGMWYSQLVGDKNLYKNADKRIRLIGRGSNIHLADFAITGNLNYRSDREANDGIVGSFGTNSTIARIWIEHTKVGMWIENSQNLKITDCRMRNTMADGINFCVGMNRSTIENCTARGTGDDCFAIWPAVFAKQQFEPGHNLIKNCTAQLPYLANGAAIYGGNSNQIESCSFADITQGSAILVSTTFPTENADKSINNNFSGITTIKNCKIETSGGFDHEWDWRAAIEICLDKRSINGIVIKDIKIRNSLSNAVSVIAKNKDNMVGTLNNAQLQNINIENYSVGVKNKYALYVSNGAKGYLNINKSNLSKIYNNSSEFKVLNKNSSKR